MSELVKSNGMTGDLTSYIRNMRRVARIEKVQKRTKFLKFTRSGEWVLGQDKENLEGESVLFNPSSWKKSWCAFFQNKPDIKGEVPIHEDLGLRPDPLNGVIEYKVQHSIEGKIIYDQDTSVLFTFSSSSGGGVKAFQELIDPLCDQLDEDPSKRIMIIKLRKGGYTHENFGYINEPLFEIQGWATQEEYDSAGANDDDGGDEPPVDESPEPRRRRRA